MPGDALRLEALRDRYHRAGQIELAAIFDALANDDLASAQAAAVDFSHHP
jgi:hypothetical protein